MELSKALDPLMDEIEDGLLTRVVGGAFFSGIKWAALGLLVAVGIGWLVPMLLGRPAQLWSHILIALGAMVPCVVIGWWTGFSGGVARGIGLIVGAMAPVVFEVVFDWLDYSDAMERGITQVGQRLRGRAEAVSAKRGDGIMGRFRASVFEYLAEGAQTAFTQLKIGEKLTSATDLRAPFVQKATDFVTEPFEAQARRARWLAMIVWGVVLVVGYVLMSLVPQ